MADIDRLVGKWRIVETGAWPREHLDLCGPAFLHVDHNGQGEMAFGALDASLNCGFTPDGIDFEWNGADEGDQVSGDGWADLRDDGCLEGEIAYHNGDETTFIAEPWERFSTTEVARFVCTPSGAFLSGFAAHVRLPPGLASPC